MEKKINKGDVLYWARIIPNCDYYEIEEIKVRTVTDKYFVGINQRNKQAYILSCNEIDKIVFKDRKYALTTVKEAEKNRVAISDEKFYEEY